MTEFMLPSHRIEGLVPCDSCVVGSVIGVHGVNLNTIRQTVGGGCFIRYEDPRLPRQQSEGYFYIQANTHESVGNAILLLQKAEKEAILRRRRPQKPIIIVPPPKVESSTMVLKKEQWPPNPVISHCIHGEECERLGCSKGYKYCINHGPYCEQKMCKYGPLGWSKSNY